MKNELLFCLLLSTILTSCKKSDDASKICLINDSGHDIHFWLLDSKGYSQNHYDSYCTENGNADNTFFWAAKYPTSEPGVSATGHSYFAIWQGTFEVSSEDIDFHFTDTSGTLVYDFRDSLTGNYTFTETTLEVSGSDTVAVSSNSYTGQVSKAKEFNQVILDLSTSVKDTLIFDRYIHTFKLDGSMGHLINNAFDWEKIDYLQTDYYIKQIVIGKKG